MFGGKWGCLIVILVVVGLLVPVVVVVGNGVEDACEEWMIEVTEEKGSQESSLEQSVSIFPPGLRCTGHWNEVDDRRTVVVPWDS